MYDAEFHVLISEKPEFVGRIKNFLEYGLHNCKKSNILVRLLAVNNPSNLEKEVEQYCTENLKIEVLRFESDEPSFKKTTYLLDILAGNIGNAKWYIGIDEDTITDVDVLLSKLDEEFDWEKEVYAVPGSSSANSKNVQAMEFDLACLMGKQHWYTPEGGPFHEQEIACLSQGAVKTILTHPESLRGIKLRQKIRKGWGDHFMGLIARLAKIHASHCLYINPHPLVFDHTIIGGWLVHVHHIYQIPGIKHILPLLKNKNTNNKFSNRKIFMIELVNKNPEDRGFFNLEKRGVITGPPNYKSVGVWTLIDEDTLQLSFHDKPYPMIFNLKDETPTSQGYPLEQNMFQILAG